MVVECLLQSQQDWISITHTYMFIIFSIQAQLSQLWPIKRYVHSGVYNILSMQKLAQASTKLDQKLLKWIYLILTQG